ncbi:hypothetical protein C482_17288 [Natrialba chahannaoensis JCM 10990]|uniref:DUF3784 domain-containing protein n=1 Tax=Natrialba chahannaoensis JCM 10990 TaxID=1227492 RepID=M0A903_9EURY|nr:hypothetical protein [Natrialba chahannaoensis]ELY94851.1 hypothetical protein C482_17288 [Natrialba chahannaoensis JCM 10990]
MVDPNVIAAVVWYVCGGLILYLGYLIAVRGRADLHAEYDESVDPAYVSRWAGGTALVMGGLVVAYATHQLLYGFDPFLLGALIVALLVLSYVTKLFARGYGYRGD